MPAPGEHKTVQARILEYAVVIGSTGADREDGEERRAGFPARRVDEDAGWKTRAPLKRSQRDGTLFGPKLGWIHKTEPRSIPRSPP